VLTDSLLREPTADSVTSSRQSVLRDTGSADAISRLSIGRRESVAEGGRASTENGYTSGATSRYGSAAADSGYSTSRRLSRAISTYDTEGTGDNFTKRILTKRILKKPILTKNILVLTKRILPQHHCHKTLLYKTYTHKSLQYILNLVLQSWSR
jgi:hypothetical protein